MKMENLDTVKQIFEEYCEKNIKDEDLEKVMWIDTYIYPFEFEKEDLKNINKLAPF
jgi:single-stranded DNA-specific DHH superfamily exonuclease